MKKMPYYYKKDFADWEYDEEWTDEYYWKYDEEYFSPKNLGNSSEDVKRAVYNICRFFYGGWDTSHQEYKTEFEKLVKFFENPDRILMNIVTLREQDMENLPVLVLQIATFRFLKIHLPQIYDTLEKNDWKNSGELWNNFSLWSRVKVEDWERPFWLIASGQNLRRGAKRPFNPFWKEKVIESQCYKNEGELTEDERKVGEEIEKSAMKHKDTIEKIRQLQQVYETYALKAEKLNRAGKQYTDEQREEKLVAVQDMKKIIEMMEKNFLGELTTSDMVEAEKQLPEWKKYLENLTETINELFSCLG